MHGPILLHGQTTLPRLWDWLHRNGEHWQRLYEVAPHHRNLATLDEVDRRNLGMLAQCPANRWITFCEAAGTTPLGAVALSWCVDAELRGVWEMWQTAVPALEPSPAFLRPTRLLSPNAAPRSRRLSNLVRQSQDDGMVLCILIAAVGSELEFDLDDGELRRANTRIAAFLNAAIAQKSNPNAQELALQDHWNTVTQRNSSEYAN